MATPFTERYELFKTVKSLHNQGKITLSATEQSQIEQQTMDLIRKSVLNKSAGKVPEGFENLLRKIETAMDAEEAYAIIKDFMKSEGVLDSDGDMDGSPMGDGDDDADDKPRGGKGPMGDGDDDADDKPMGGKGPMGDKPDGFPKGNPVMDAKPMDSPEGKGPLGDKLDGTPVGKHEGPSKGKGPMGGGKPGGVDVGEMKAKVLRQAAEQGERGNLSDLQDQAAKKGKQPSETEMGLEETEGTAYSSGADEDHSMQASARASRVKVVITRSKTLVAHHVDFGPIFHAVPSSDIRNNPAALRRLANKVYGLCVHDGYAKAAEMCNAKLLPNIQAGVDDDVELDSDADVPAASKGINQDGERDVRETYDDGDTTVLTGGEMDTQEKPDTVTASARRRAVSLHARVAMEMAKSGKDILDDADNVNRPSEAKPKKPSMSVTDNADTLAVEEHGDPGNDSLEGYDNDIRNAQKHMTALYAKRLDKRVAEEKEAFIRRFTRAMRIVSTRMRLNHLEHPLKVASVDVLAAEGGEIAFADDDLYSGMDVSAAVELTELIMQEGQDQFVQAILEKSADLMQKDDKYLSDIESDLFDQAPVRVKVEASARKSTTQRKASNIRREAVDGSNFDGNDGHPIPRPAQFTTNENVSTALGGDTRIGRRLGRYQGLGR
jgi:hypothetical protein